jgi:hypothetical protein
MYDEIDEIDDIDGVVMLSIGIRFMIYLLRRLG